MQWILIKDRLPEVGTHFLVTDGKKICFHECCMASIYDQNSKWVKQYHISCYCEWKECLLLMPDHRFDWLDNFTHWMPLPELPKK